ncbi:MBL fold metallo-hydrolase [Providencia rettgeri]|uniref:MBL fold metallo-hydrolase n=1 Tax=Providencia rettgeri TaxID=587 RepID=UPI0032DBB4B2
MVEIKTIIVETGRPEFVNYIYIVYDELSLDCVIIDPGWGTEYIVNLLKKYRLSCQGILVSHSHLDHIGCASQLSNELNCPVYISKLEAKQFSYNHNSIIFIEDNIEIHIGSLKCYFWNTPGHTIGSLCFKIGDNIFTGDTLFIEGCGLSTEQGGSVEKLFDSIKFLSKNIKDTDLIYPAHLYNEQVGQPFFLVKEKNIYLKMSNFTTFKIFASRKLRDNNYPPSYHSVQNPSFNILNIEVFNG